MLGFAWIVGALTALQHERDIVPAGEDLMIGTSAGAVTAALLGCGIEVDGMRRHQLGMPLPEDPPIAWNYDRDSGGSVPPRPGWRPGSPRLVWGGLRHPSEVPPIVALSGLLPAGRGDLSPIGDMIRGLGGQLDSGWPETPVWLVATDYVTGRRAVFGQPSAPRAMLAEAVRASCAIPGWYAPVRIGGRSYVDGGTVSNASVDLVTPGAFDEVFVFAPMAALVPDSPRAPVAMIERRIRKAVTRGIMRDVNRLRGSGTRVTVLTPNTEDLSVMGANLMNPRRRIEVLRSAMRTVAAELHTQSSRAGQSRGH